MGKNECGYNCDSVNVYIGDRLSFIWNLYDGKGTESE